jgi:predicted nucleic acid-binding protein
MRSGVLLDAGPLVAYFDQREEHHQWAVETFATVDLPAITCEAVLAEACFLVARTGRSPSRVLDHVRRKNVRVGLSLGEELEAVATLMDRYSNIPMSLADACLVRLAEMTGLPICTLDSDFRIYRAQGRRSLDLITPPASRLLHEP